MLEEWFFEQLGRKRRVEVVTANFTLAAHLIVGTDRVATMHAWLARECAKVLPVRIVKTPIELPRVTECMQWHQYREPDPGIRWLRQMLKGAVPARNRA